MPPTVDPAASTAAPPVRQRAMVARPRLLDRLRARWSVPVTVVSAPAGYGKTTLLGQAVAANAVAPVGVDHWVACGPGTEVAASLAAALGEALARPAVGPGGFTPRGAGRAGAAGHLGVRPTGRLAERLHRAGPAEAAAAVADALWQRAPQPVALIVDDVHEVAAGSEAAQLLDLLIARLPANGHLVLAGRGDPPVRLARHDLAGRVARVGQADLALTAGEAAELATLRGRPAADLAACGGWPALAELVASGLVGADRGAVGARARDYVGEEVLCGLRPSDRRALAVLAHLGWFDEELACAAVGPDAVAAGLVGGLVAGLPLAAGDGRGGWRLHGLWATLLAGDATADEVAAGRRRAGLALAARGEPAAAVPLLIDAGAGDDLADVLAEALGAAHPPVARDVLAGWSARLRSAPDEPPARLLRAVLATDCDPDGARGQLEACAAAFRDAGHVAGELACLVHLGQLAWWSEDPAALAVVVGRAFELEEAGCAAVVPLACLGRALLADIANDSRRMLAELDRIVPGTLNDAWSGIVAWARAIGLLELGHTCEALAAADEAVAHAGALHAPLAQTTRLQALWFQGRTGEVPAALDELLRRARRSGYRNHVALLAAQCSVAHALAGRVAEAAALLAEARGAAEVAPDAPLVDTNLSVAEAAVAVAAGDEAGAAAVLAAHVARRGVRDGMAAAPQQRHLALAYVLVPATRPVWDAADLGPAWAFARGLARALVALRERGDLPADAPALDDVAVVGAHLPPPWVAELGVGAVAAGRDDGWALLDGTWAASRPAVAALAERGAGVGRAARQVLGRLAVPPPDPLALRLLGPVELDVGDAPTDAADWRRQRVRALLAHLVLGGTVTREQLADDLWPDLDAEAQSRNLRVTLTYLLRVLEPERGRRDASYFVRQHGANLTLHAGDRLTVDLWRFGHHADAADAAAGRGDPAEALDHALLAVGLWRGEPVELAHEPWAIPRVEDLRRRFAALAARAGELLVARDEGERARALAERALAVDPWLEAAHRLVVSVHLARGEAAAARRSLRRYREVVDDLGVGPGEATLMVERLVAGLPEGPGGAAARRRPA